MKKEKLLGLYRTFIHKFLYVEGYDKKVLVILLLLMVADLVVLYLIW